ncbi:MAG TPA: hypothetical protein VFG29_12640 [Syntrophales bacterium]|nr:hypothetical protein [Syntrophales bacterium]
MKNRMQARQGGVGQIRPAGRIIPLGRRADDRKEASSTQKNVRTKTSAKIVKELKRSQGRKAGTKDFEYRMHYTEDNVIGIAWSDVVFK